MGIWSIWIANRVRKLASRPVDLEQMLIEIMEQTPFQESFFFLEAAPAATIRAGKAEQQTKAMEPLVTKAPVTISLRAAISA